MLKITANLHPKRDYAIVRICNGYITELPAYVRDIPWIVFLRNEGKPLYYIHGKTNSAADEDKHILRAEIFLQRILSAYKDAEILVRDETGDPLTPYHPEKFYTEKEMLSEECVPSEQFLSDSASARGGIAQFRRMCDFAPNDAEYQKWLAEEEARLENIQEKEKQRIQRIKEMWG